MRLLVIQGALTTVLALTFVLTVVWYAWDWGSGGRARRRQRREQCANKTTMPPHGINTNSNYVN